MDPFIGEIRIFAGSFAPKGWALCQGQLMAIASNSALFSILGTTYGGDGRVTFGLPDLRGRVVIGVGQGPGLQNYVEGQQGGVETVSLNTAQMPAHTHMIIASEGASTDDPNGAFPANSGGTNIYSTTPGGILLNPAAVTPAGGQQPVSLLQPFTVINYIIALEGVYPSRG